MDGLPPIYMLWGALTLVGLLLVWAVIERAVLKLGNYSIDIRGYVTKDGLAVTKLEPLPGGVPHPYYVRRGDWLAGILGSSDVTFWRLVALKDGLVTATTLPDRMFFAHCLGHLVHPVNPLLYALWKPYRKRMEALADAWAAEHYTHPHVVSLRLWLYQKENGRPWTGK